MLGGESDKIYLITADMGSPSGQGLDFISKSRSASSRLIADDPCSTDGFAFLQRFYSVYDTGNAQVGLATTAFTDATTN